MQDVSVGMYMVFLLMLSKLKNEEYVRLGGCVIPSSIPY